MIKVDAIGKMIHLNLTKEQVQKSADIHTHKPVARRLQIDYVIYLGRATAHLKRFLKANINPRSFVRATIQSVRA